MSGSDRETGLATKRPKMKDRLIESAQGFALENSKVLGSGQSKIYLGNKIVTHASPVWCSNQF
jgi:hypothetical protein